jgi:hypothetical protein
MLAEGSKRRFHPPDNPVGRMWQSRRAGIKSKGIVRRRHMIVAYVSVVLSILIETHRMVLYGNVMLILFFSFCELKRETFACCIRAFERLIGIAISNNV